MSQTWLLIFRFFRMLPFAERLSMSMMQGTIFMKLFRSLKKSFTKVTVSRRRSKTGSIWQLIGLSWKTLWQLKATSQRSCMCCTTRKTPKKSLDTELLTRRYRIQTETFSTLLKATTMLAICKGLMLSRRSSFSMRLSLAPFWHLQDPEKLGF